MLGFDPQGALLNSDDAYAPTGGEIVEQSIKLLVLLYLCGQERCLKMSCWRRTTIERTRHSEARLHCERKLKHWSVRLRRPRRRDGVWVGTTVSCLRRLSACTGLPGLTK